MTELHSFLQDYLEEYDFSQAVELDQLKEKHGSHGMGQGKRRYTAFKEMADLFWSESYPKNFVWSAEIAKTFIIQLKL